MPEPSPPIDRLARTPAPAGAAMDQRVARSRTARLRRWAAPAILLLLALAGAGLFLLVPSAGTLSVAADEITTEIVQQAPFHDDLPVRATVAPLRTVFVAAVQGGTVDRVAALDGSVVRRGDVLATLSNPQLQLDVTSREATIAGELGGISAQRLSLEQNLTGQDGAIAQTGYELLKAQRELAIRQHLHDQGFESDAGVKGFQDEVQYETARLATLRAARLLDRDVAGRQQGEIDQAAATLASTLDEVRSSLQALTLRAPVAGRLTAFDLQPGQTLKQGDAIGRIDSLDAYRLDADIDEFYLGRVAEGQHAVASFDGTDVAMTVSRVKPQVSNGQFRAELTFDHAPPPGLRRGESAEARITLGQTRTTLVLPNGPWLEGSGGSFVFVLGPGGHRAVRRAIVSGRRNPEQVEITGGLTPGERVITSSYARYQNFSHLLVQ